MDYRWKPSKSQKRAFIEKMNDPEFKKAYLERKAKREERRRATSDFDYETAGGWYIPTKAQYEAALELLSANPTPKQKEAANHVMIGFSSNEKVHHDYIHIVNEYIRNNSDYRK